MNFDIIYYILLIILIIVDIILYIDNLINDTSSSFYKNKIQKRMLVKDNIIYLKEDFYTVIDLSEKDKIEIIDEINGIKVTCINLDKKIICDTFIIGKNILNIQKLDLYANKVISNSDNIKVQGDFILDKFDNIVCIFKEKTKEELLEISKNYSIRRDALRYFTNAKYYQFVYTKGLFDIRYSKPYYDTNEHLFAIVPLRVNEKTIDSVTINFNIIDYIYLPKTVKRVVIEKKTEFEDIEIDRANNSLAIYKNSLLYKNNKLYINNNFNTLNKVGTENKKDINSTYKTLSRKYLSINKINGYKILANDLQ